MNQFERPPLNQSKQALSNMLRNRHPSYMNQQNPQVPPNFTMQQTSQQRIMHQGNPQMRQNMGAQQQNMQFMRNANQMRQGINPMSNQVAAGPMTGNNPAINQGIAGGQVQGPSNQMAGMMQQQQNTGMMSGGQVNNQMMGNQMGAMANQQNIPQQNMNVNVNAGNMNVGQMGNQIGQQMPNTQMNSLQMGSNQMGNQGGNTGGGQMFQNQYQGNVNQNYQGYNQQGMNTGTGGGQQQGMMNNFNQGVQGVQGVGGVQSNVVQPNQRNPQDMYVQQRLQNRVPPYMQQGGQQTPNVTMNTQMVGNMGNNAGAPPVYPRQQGGKPNMNPNQQNQYALNAQRLRQQQLLLQQQQQQQGEFMVENF